LVAGETRNSRPANDGIIHFGKRVPFDLRIGEKHVFIGQQRVLAASGFFNRAIDDTLRRFANLAR
jgi:hypothetical protein